MGTKQNDSSFQLRLYDPDGLAALRGPREHRGSATSKTSIHDQRSVFSDAELDNLKSPTRSLVDCKSATRDFLRSFVSTLNPSEHPTPCAVGVFLPSGDAAIVLPVWDKQRIYVAAILASVEGYTRTACSHYADLLGGRLAERAENRKVAKSLLDAVQAGVDSPSQYNRLLLNLYKNTCILDAQGSVYIVAGKVRSERNLQRSRLPDSYGLIVFDL
jgi:hypothetical protein